MAPQTRWQNQIVGYGEESLKATGQSLAPDSRVSRVASVTKQYECPRSLHAASAARALATTRDAATSDAGNFSKVWSGMLVFRDGVQGGALALPEFDLAVMLKHKGLFFFDGQGILHGVTPMRLMRPDAKRYSLVYYSMKGMWQCEPLGAEVARIRRKRTEREARRAATPVIERDTSHLRGRG